MPISPDLTDGIIYEPRFHFISAIAQSLLNNNYLMAGTSDGNVWISIDGGTNWNTISSTLPDRYVTAVHFSPNTLFMAYATHSGYKDGEFIPHIHRTIDNGLTWTDISSNLPQLAVNDLQTYPGNDSILFAATDGGVYGTTDAGQTWNRIGNNMPVIPVYDIDRDPFSNKLLAGTFARSMWSYPIDSILVISGINENTINVDISVYPNPSSDYLTIKCDRQDFSDRHIYIYSAKGDLVSQSVFSRIGDNIYIKNLDQGIYFLKLENQKMEGVTRFIKL